MNTISQGRTPPPRSTAPATQEYTVEGGKADSIWMNLREIWRYRALIGELTGRELKIRYKNRVGGAVWSLFPPLMQVLTITIMVKLFMAPVSNYSAYLMPVVFLWQFFQNTVMDCSNSIVNNHSLVRKIYFPRAILPLVALINNLIHLAVALSFTLVYYLVQPFGSPIYPANLRWEAIFVLPIILGVGMLALGLGFMVARLTTLYEDVRYLLAQGMTLFMYCLPILYPVEKVLVYPKIYSFYMLNPLAAYVVGFQRSLLPPLTVKVGSAFQLEPVGIPWLFLIIAAATSVFALGFGFYNFERSKWTMMERL